MHVFHPVSHRRKQTVEIQGKLKAALADRVAAIADKANLERLMKQSKSQALTLEKTLEKKDAVENKKRESILIVSAFHNFDSDFESSLELISYNSSAVDPALSTMFQPF